MLTNRKAILGLALGLAAGLWSGCGSRGPVIHQMTAEELYAHGEAAFERGRWDDAIVAFERLVLAHPGSPQRSEARFLLADAHFQKREYVTAAAEFTRLAADQPAGPYAARARFRACEAYYRLSPNVQLDQTHTKAAVDHCEALIRAYPNSEYTSQAREMVAELRDKLAQKVFVAGEFYFRRRAYDSAILVFEDVANNHPHTSVAPRALLMLVESYQRIGWTDEAERARERLLREYPDTAEAEEAREMSLARGA